MRRKINSLARRISSPYAPAYPVFAWITPTTRCNLRCITCARTVDPHWKSMDLEPEVYEIVRNEIIPHLICVELSGTGEPFLAPIFYKLLEDVIRHGVEFSITTNLTILPEQNVLREIIQSSGNIKISIDGTDRQTLQHIRRGLNYDVFMNNLEQLADLAKRLNNPSFSLEFNYVITRSNVEQIPSVIELAHQKGIKCVIFSSFLVGNRNDEFIAESLLDRPDIVLPYLEQAKKRARELNIDIYPPAFGVREAPSAKEKKSQTEEHPADMNIPKGQCPHPWWSVYIDVDGSVMPCCVFGVPFGNLKQQPFKKIWNGPIYRHFRRIVNSPNMPEGCKKCTLNVRL